MVKNLFFYKVKTYYIRVPIKLISFNFYLIQYLLYVFINTLHIQFPFPLISPLIFLHFYQLYIYQHILISLIYNFIKKMMNKVVEDYVLMQSVGKGQYGNVYRAQHRKTKQLYAIKVMSLDKFKQTPKLSEFTNNQINILTKINHPNIIKFIQMLRTTNNVYLVYEFCNGGTLADYIKSKKRLPEDEAIKIFTQLRSAFELLNREKILHRDLKPTNILFHNGVVKIADFGFCKEMMSNELTQTMVGSPIYMAPQVLKGSVYDNRADIWSLGVIFYEMLYGFCPYEESSISKLIGLIDNTLLKFPPQVPVSHHIQVLLKRMMTTKYRERISAEELLRYPLDIKQTQSTITKSQRLISLTILKDVMIFARKSMTYIAECLQNLANKLDDSRQKYAQICFLVYKILSTIQKDVAKNSPYWEFTRTPNNDEQWDVTLNGQIYLLQQFGQMIKQAVIANGASLPLRMQIQSTYIDYKYFLDMVSNFNAEHDTKNKLLTCLLIHRHYILAMEKKTIDFTDFTQSKRTVEEKEDICKKFAYTRT